MAVHRARSVELKMTVSKLRCPVNKNYDRSLFVFIKRNHDPAEWISQVMDFWLQTLPYLIRLPLSDRQRQFAMRWKKP